MHRPRMANVASICVYCGANPGHGGEFVSAASRLGAAMARRGLALVYGGGGIGLMGAVANAVLAEGGRVRGVIPTFLRQQELAHSGVEEMLVVETMHERKWKMMELSDAFVALPGGFGTLEELFEVLAWGQLRLHQKPVGLLNVGGFYDDLLRFLDRAVADGLLRQGNRDRILASSDPDRLLDILTESGRQPVEPPPIPR